MMNGIIRLLEKTNDVKRSSYVWNAISAIMLAIQSPIIMMVMTRTNGVKAAGVFSIAIAVANLMMYVGQYGLRRFQSSDINEQFKFSEYHGMRVLTCVIMVVSCIVYCAYGAKILDYSAEKFTVVYLICMLKLFQAYSDVYHGHMQQRGRLDVATKCSAIRYLVEIAVYCLALTVTRQLLISTIITVLASLVVMILTSINAGRVYCDTLRPEFKGAHIKILLIEGFPLFVSMFLNMYVGNAPKYAIDACLDDKTQAIFNMIFMPAFVIQLIAHFIFNPILTTYAELWQANNQKNYNKLIKLIKRQLVIIGGLLVLALIVAATIGLPILSWFFGVNLRQYKAELCIIMVGGAMLACATYFSTIIAIIRAQRSLIICYGLVSILSLAVSNYLVHAHGIIGATILYAILMFVLAVSLFVVVIINFKRKSEILNND